MSIVGDVVANKARAAGAGRWLSGLPDLVREIEAGWDISVGRRYDDATEALVAEAVLEETTPVVLKILMPREGIDPGREIDVLLCAGGVGCARLLRHDRVRGALLLERLGPSLHDLSIPVTRRHSILCETAALIWRQPPPVGLPNGAEKARWLIEFITRTWAELDHPCAERTVEHAIVCAGRRMAAHDDERSVLVHGDVHAWNALRATEGFKLVDPDGLLAEAEYDLGIIMREDPVDLVRGDPHERARRLATLTGLDATAIWEWGVVERVSTGLLCTQVDLQPVGRQMLEAADRIAG